jgi:L-rhamnose mutarotase
MEADVTLAAGRFDLNPSTVSYSEVRQEATFIPDLPALAHIFIYQSRLDTRMAEETERAVYLQRIDPECREEYATAHDDVPGGVKDAMERGGVEEFQLYVRDDVAVCILEAKDIDEYLETVDGDEAVEEWERHVAQFKRKGVDVDDEEEPIPFMDRIWSLPEDG